MLLSTLSRIAEIEATKPKDWQNTYSGYTIFMKNSNYSYTYWYMYLADCLYQTETL